MIIYARVRTVISKFNLLLSLIDNFLIINVFAG